MIVVGAPERLTATFTDSTGTLYDPSTVTFTVTLPDGTVDPGSPFTAVKDAVGEYHYDYVTSVAGIHQYYPTGTTGGVPAIGAPEVFTVAPLTTAALISVADAKQALNIDADYDGDDSELLLTVRAATDVINYLAGYTVATSVSEVLGVTCDRYGRGVIILSHPPVMTVQTLTPQLAGAPVVAAADTTLDALTGALYIPAGVGWSGPYQVEYTAGRSGVPAALQEACRILVQHMWDTQRSGATVVPGAGGDDTADMTQFGLPMRVLELVQFGGYKKPAGVA